MSIVFKNVISGYKSLDYIFCWFYKGAEYIKDINAQLAFVSTNSICQGVQVAILWPYIKSLDIEIGFTHPTFKWTNNAKSNANVICCIVGLRNCSKNPKYIYKNNIKSIAKNISFYLKDTPDIFIKTSKIQISNLPKMDSKSMANDGGNLIIQPEKFKEIITKNPKAKKYIKKFLGAKEFINGIDRYCLWVDKKDSQEQLFQELFSVNIQNCKEYRENSRKQFTRNLANYPYRFAEVRHQKGQSIIIPRVSSERRKYIPCGFLDDETIISAALAIYNAEEYIFGIINSNIHMVWVRNIAGRLKTDYRYSVGICYNTFPVPTLTDRQKSSIRGYVYNVLDEREKHSEKTLAQLYDPDKMPDGLRQAHLNLDLAVERCYRSKPFISDEDRLEYLLKLYEEMTNKEKMGELL